MFEILFKLILAFFLIVGIVGCCRGVIGFLLRGCSEGRVTMMICLKNGCDEAEYVIRSAAERLKWMGGREEKRLLCVDRGMDEKTRKICELLQKEYPFIHICTDAQESGGEEENGTASESERNG